MGRMSSKAGALGLVAGCLTLAGALANAALLLIRCSGASRIGLLRIGLLLLRVLLWLLLLHARRITIRSSVGAVVANGHSSAYRHGAESLA